jgi:heme/copper-type cytochrome/quinol oxidase subunit 2
MRVSRPFLLFALAALSSAVIVATPAAACAVCYGDPDAAMSAGLNNAVAFLLGIVAVVQVGFVALFWSFRRRAKERARRKASLEVIEGGAH